MLHNTCVTTDQLIHLIAKDLGLSISSRSKIDLIKAIYAELIGQYNKGRRVIIIMGEAQSLSDAALEELRLEPSIPTLAERQCQLHPLSTTLAIGAIHSASDGRPRFINLICDAVLAYGMADEAKLVTGQMIKRVIRDRVVFGFDTHPKMEGHRWRRVDNQHPMKRVHTSKMPQVAASA